MYERDIAFESAQNWHCIRNLPPLSILLRDNLWTFICVSLLTQILQARAWLVHLPVCILWIGGFWKHYIPLLVPTKMGQLQNASLRRSYHYLLFKNQLLFCAYDLCRTYGREQNYHQSPSNVGKRHKMRIKIERLIPCLRIPMHPPKPWASSKLCSS